MNTIHLLDELTINQIAAGEVVERPVSVIKELIENSIDAGALHINLEISGGGIDYIRVIDDGCGMTVQDALLSIQRHATSKILTAQDLQTVDTLGFRGEALASIASVAKMALITRKENAALGFGIKIEGGEVIEQGEAGSGLGTTITVSDLFYNTPARRKFLKSPAGESGQIHDMVGRIALSHPQISFSLINNNKPVLKTPGSNLLDCITSIYGCQVEQDLIKVNFAANQITVTGFIGKPHLIKSSRKWQTFLVNSRVIQSRMLANALEKAYHSLIPHGFPFAVLNIDVLPEIVDVNVHPRKAEVKFSDESLLYKTIYKAVKTALEIQQPLQEIAASTNLNQIGTPLIHPNNNTKRFFPIQPYTPPVPYINQSALELHESAFTEKPPSLEETRAIIKNQSVLLERSTELISQQEPQESDLIPIGQMAACYIIAHSNENLYLIDQHAAHERIIYDKLMSYTDKIPSQPLLIPLVLTVDRKEALLIESHQSELTDLGLSIELWGPETIRISELPVDIPESEVAGLLKDLMRFWEQYDHPTPQLLREEYIKTASCRGAIKAGEMLNLRQMQALLSELQTTTLPYTCPHGRPTIIRFTTDDIAKMFKRT